VFRFIRLVTKQKSPYALRLILKIFSTTEPFHSHESAVVLDAVYLRE
jgi:hypothetical protein